MASLDEKPQLAPESNTTESAPATNGSTSLKDTAVNSEVGCPSNFDSAPVLTYSESSSRSLLCLTISGAASAVNAVKNHPITQDLTNGTSQSKQEKFWHSLFEGPMATSVKNQANATGSEFNSLANSRTAPSHTAANDTPLTREHCHWRVLVIY